MKIYSHTRDVCISCHPFVTMGAFDGIHLGHRAILDQMKMEAKEADVETIAVIFSPHPRRVLEPSLTSRLNLLTSLEEKEELMASAGIDNLVILPFTHALASLDYTEFVREYLWEPLHMQRYYAGHDHGFGKGRAGGFEALSILGNHLGFAVTRVAPILLDDVPVSSTRIRITLEQGRVRETARLLGYEYRLSGTVIHGNRLGHTIGYPTANILPSDPDKMIPGQGVYAVLVHHKSTSYHGMMNIGIRPTMQLREESIEVHIFDFQRNIYGDPLEIRFIDRIRDEKHFNNLQDLARQLNQDKAKAQEILTAACR